MRILLNTLLVISILLSTSFTFKNNWEYLLDKDLSKWNKYLSFQHVLGYSGKAPMDEKGNLLVPIGLNKDEKQVFTVIEEKGELVLHVSGEIYGCVFTKQHYRNYHLQLKTRWGTKKWQPRLNEPMDSGVLYHSIGEPGVDYWRSWMLGQEFQIMEASNGDYWPIASSAIDIPAVKPNEKANYMYQKNAKLVPFGAGAPQYYCQKGETVENKYGEWNTLDLICFEGKSLHIVNGKVVMALSNSRYKAADGSEKPLVEGAIQLQSEAGEVFFKDIKIKPIERLPRKYARYFE